MDRREGVSGHFPSVSRFVQDVLLQGMFYTLCLIFLYGMYFAFVCLSVMVGLRVSVFIPFLSFLFESNVLVDIWGKCCGGLFDLL